MSRRLPDLCGGGFISGRLARLLGGIDAALRRLMPRPFWAYIVVRGVTPASRSEKET